MKTKEILELDYSQSENKKIIQKALKKIKPFSKYEDEDVKMCKIEKFIGVAVKKYDLCVRDISFAGITIDNKCIYSLHLINESKLQYFDTVYGCELYELIAKAAIYIYSLIKEEKVGKRNGM